MKENQTEKNSENLTRALEKARLRFADELNRSEFFTGTLTVSVQNGIIRTSKIGIEECDNFVVKN